MKDPTPSEAVLSFVLHYLEDLRAGAVKPVESYQAQYPGWEQFIAREYRRFEEQIEDGGATKTYSGALEKPFPDILGTNRILRELGSGAMGRVYLAELTEDRHSLPAGHKVALKVVRSHLFSSPGFFKRFLHEGQIGKQIRHANVLKTFDIDATVSGGRQFDYLVMEYVEGQTLADLLLELERVPEDLCRHIGSDAAKGLEAIHATGVVHRDIKPANVMITQGNVVKIMDLGIARLNDQATPLSNTGQFLGSLAYAAPEQFSGKPLDGRSDLYSLGIMLHELATGKPPFTDQSFVGVMQRHLQERPRRIGELNPQYSSFFEEVVFTLLAKDPEHRFATAGELVEALEKGENSSWWRQRSGEIRVETKRPLRRMRIPRTTALFGRQDSLVRLRNVYELTKRGAGQVVFLEGETGVGKTRLINEFVQELVQSGEDVNFLFGSYLPDGASTPAAAFVGAYIEYLGSDDLDLALRRYMPSSPLLIPSFVAFLRGEPPPNDSPPLNVDSVHSAFIQITQSLAAERPTIIVVDDLHYAPEEGKGLFAALAFALREHRVLTVGCAQPDFPKARYAELLRQSHASRIPLERLEDRDLELILREALRSDVLAAELVERIARKSEGNPLFVFEILSGLTEADLLKQGPDGAWVTTRKIDRIDLPSSIIDIIQARIADLSETDRELLEIAAVCGNAFDPDLVCEVLKLEKIDALKRFARLERNHRLIRAAGSRFVFDHSQIREALYDGLPEALRREYHGVIGHVVASHHSEAPSGVPGEAATTICEHLIAGERWEEARAYLHPALAHYTQRHQMSRALKLADRALGKSEFLPRSQRSQVLQLKARCLHDLSRYEEEESALGELIELYGSEPTVALVTVYLMLGRNASSQARYESARDWIQHAMDMAADLNHEEMLAWCMEYLGGVLSELGDVAEAKERHGQALKIFRNIDNLRGVARATESTGRVLERLGHYAEARDRFVQARAFAKSTNNYYKAAKFDHFEAMLLYYLGDHDRAKTLQQSSLSLFRKLGSPLGIARSMSLGGRIALDRHEFAEARNWFDQGLSIAEKGKLEKVRARLLLGLGQLHRALGDNEEASRCLIDCSAVAKRLHQAAPRVLSSAYIAELEGRHCAAARKIFAKHNGRCGHRIKIEANFSLWKSTGEQSFIREALRLLMHLSDNAPEEYCSSCLQNVALYRDITEASAGVF